MVFGGFRFVFQWISVVFIGFPLFSIAFGLSFDPAFGSFLWFSLVSVVLGESFNGFRWLSVVFDGFQ